jgi:hypothetical protein
LVKPVTEPVIEEGEVLFDLTEAKNGTLRLMVQRLGRPKPSRLEICRDRDQGTPSAKRSQRMAYERKLEHALERSCPRFSVTRPKSSVDLERPFGPIYARGVLQRGTTVFAVLG